MRFHGLMILRDEVDIIAQNLTHFLSWIDSLYVLDTGSVDGTWDIVQEYARKDSRIIPFFSKPIVYGDQIRSMLFHEYRARFEAGDWVVKADADEFYQVSPPQFVAERLQPLDTAVHLQWYFFRLTKQETEAYESGKVNIDEDRKRPIEDRRRYYKLSTYAEPRMFRYRRSMRWPQNESFPFNAGFVSKERIPIRHYPHRDPRQMERRYRLRAKMMKLNAQTGDHWRLEDWRQEIVNSDGVSPSKRTKVGLNVLDSLDNGPLLYWKPGTSLEEHPLHNHVPSPIKRLQQRIVHPLLLPILDRHRPPYNAAACQLTPIPPDVASTIYDWSIVD